jgi:MFS transporter, NNP family, nitrate/nitrite transporter
LAIRHAQVEASFLAVFLSDQFSVSSVTTGSLRAAAALADSLPRPLGGYVADRLSGARVLERLLFVIGAAYGAMALLPSLNSIVPVVLVAMACL